MTMIARLPAPLQSSYAWQLRGACRDTTPEPFFTPETERGRRRTDREQAAKAVCARCPVVQDCLDHALRVRESHGIWGGLTPSERSSLLRAAG